MSYNLGDIAAKVRQRIRDTGYSPTETADYINDTINDIYNEYRLPFMQTTQDYTLTVGVADITNGSGLPANFVLPIDMLVTTTGYETVLPFLDVRDIDANYPDYENSTQHPSGVPKACYKYDQVIKVYPEPDSAYTVTLRYYKKPTMLADDADVPELPSEFEELIVLGGAYRILQVKDNYDQAAILQNKYDEILDKLVMRYSLNQVGTATRVRINRRRVGRAYF